MSVKLKYTVIITLISLVILPFTLLTDVFPFFRFGMFAEPVRQDIQTEQFFVTYQKADSSFVFFNPEKVGINESSFQYLLRNYYYRGESRKLLSNLRQSGHYPATKWKLYRIKSNLSLSRTDTFPVYTLR